MPGVKENPTKSSVGRPWALGPAGSHVAATTPATGRTLAAKLSSVLPHRVATVLNSLVPAKKLPARCRQPYMSRSCSRGSVRFRRGGTTAFAPRPSVPRAAGPRQTPCRRRRPRTGGRRGAPAPLRGHAPGRGESRSGPDARARPRRPRPCPSGRPGSGRFPACRSPFCARRLPVRPARRAVGEQAPGVELPGQCSGNPSGNPGSRPAAEPPGHAVPIAETLRKVTPRHSRAEPHGHRFHEEAAVRRRAAGAGRLARQHVPGPRPHGAGHNRPVRIHPVTCPLPVPPFRRSVGAENSIRPSESQHDCLQALALLSQKTAQAKHAIITGPDGIERKSDRTLRSKEMPLGRHRHGTEVRALTWQVASFPFGFTVSGVREPRGRDGRIPRPGRGRCPGQTSSDQNRPFHPGKPASPSNAESFEISGHAIWIAVAATIRSNGSA